MNFEEFQNLARLFVVGALEGEDLDHFQNARGEFGYRLTADAGGNVHA